MVNVEVKETRWIPRKHFREVEPGMLVSVYHRDFDDPFTGWVRKNKNRFIELDLVSEPPIALARNRINKSAIKKIQQRSSVSGALQRILYMNPKAYFDHV